MMQHSKPIRLALLRTCLNVQVIGIDDKEASIVLRLQILNRLGIVADFPE